MKNKYLEAYKKIKNCVADLRNEYGGNLLKSDKDNLNLMKELVDKETPMKPIKHILNEDELIESISFECPRCCKDVDDRFVGCPYCLGKLDWSDE